MILTHDNYFSKEAMIEYMSQSQFKAFESCENSALAELNGMYSIERDAFIEGSFFEAIICGKRELFEMEHPEMIAKTGANKGFLKANFQKVLMCADRFLQEKFFTDIIAKCEQQVILTGEIAGVKFKTCIDFFDRATLSEWDSKLMKDFGRLYNEKERHYEAWYFGRGYHYQAAIERELIRQNFGSYGTCGLIAATKQDTPDVGCYVFSDEVLDNALEIVETFAPKYDAIKKGLAQPERCESCKWCRQTKTITEPTVIYDYFDEI